VIKNRVLYAKFSKKKGLRPSSFFEYQGCKTQLLIHAKLESRLITQGTQQSTPTLEKVKVQNFISVSSSMEGNNNALSSSLEPWRPSQAALSIEHKNSHNDKPFHRAPPRFHYTPPIYNLNFAAPSKFGSIFTEIPLELKGKIFRTSMPGYMGMTLDETEKKLNENEIKTVIMLCEKQESVGVDLEKWYREKGFNVIYFPIQDFSIPKTVDLSHLLDQIIEIASRGENIAIHCKAGVGRTGLVLSCLAKKILKKSGEEAIKFIRQFIMGAVESPPQKAFVKTF